jgi:hypothetical protein
MDLYTAFLTSMTVLFALSAALLFLMTLLEAVRRRARLAAVYLGLMLLACVVAAGFYFFSWLI